MANTKGIPLSRVSPAFLHANSTSHTWAFSAIAEIIDNAYDPDVNASELWIDKIEANNKTCLTFTDNGAGMNPDKLIKMLSFGFCEKSVFESKSGHRPIGHYGNGFKSGSMRIANDVLVFTRHLHEQSVGMLSQTFLNRTKAETVVVPLVTWKNKDKKREDSEDIKNNIRAITTYSDFKTEERLLAELKELEKLQTGTRIILYNLKSAKNGKLELDFESNPTDILNPQTLEIDTTSVYRPVQEAIARYQISLREYCSILFLKPRMKIILRGLKVKSKLICKSLCQTEIDRYKPHWLDKPLKITYGFTCNKDNEDEYGIMMYHRNRLIKAYEKVGYQKQPNDLGVGVVGIVEVNFLQPIHNKQDFNKDEKYNTFMSALSMKTNDYWNEKKHGTNRTIDTERMVSDWLWAQCDNCLKWRRLPDGINRNLPEKWFCYMNQDASHNRCEIEEEPEDEDMSIQYSSYKKTVKLEKEREKKKGKIADQHLLLKKEKELKEREEKFKARVQTVEKICSQVTSTQLEQKKKAEGLHRMLQQAKQREASQQKLIEQLQKKRCVVKKQNLELEKAAQDLRVTHFETNCLLEDTSDLIHPPSTVSSTIGNKRKITTLLGTSVTSTHKKLIIQDEDTQDVVAFIPDPEEVVVVDLTDDLISDSCVKPDPQLVLKNKALRDKKPNVKELEKNVQAHLDKSNNASFSMKPTDNSLSLSSVLEMQDENEISSVSDNQSFTSKEIGTPEGLPSVSRKRSPSTKLNNSVRENKESASVSKEVITMTISKEVQTVAKEVENVSKEVPTVSKEVQTEAASEDDSEKTRLLEEKLEAESRLARIRNNIHELLSIVLPEVDIGDVDDIEGIISEIIRVNQE